jgi:DNA-directed RNA polymerase subunit RPC12/RpoP
MNEAVTKLIKFLKVPLLLMRIEGGYGVQPRWSDTVRKGKMRTYVSKVIEPEEYKNMTDEELLAVIEEGLYVDEGCVDGEYRHKRAAEYLDRAMYVCPDCGLSIFHSEKDIIECKRCGKKIRYLPTKELKGVNCDFPFRFTTEWYDYQCEYVSNLDLSQFGDKPIYEDETKLFEVVLYKKKKRMAKSAKVSLYQDRLTLTTDKEKIEMPFKDTHVITVLGRNKLNIYFGDKIYQLKGDKHFNALKYMNLYYRKINQESGEDDKFLGI